MGTIATITPMSKRMPGRTGQHLVWEGKITMSSSYATGGDTLTAKTMGLDRFMAGQLSCGGGIILEFLPAADPTTALVKAYRQTNPAAAGGADVPLVEVANAVNLSAIVAQARITGR